MKNIRKYWIIVIPILGLVISLIIKDPNSLLIRFHILIEYINYLKNAQWQKILFGIGLGNSLNVIGIGAHNIFITNFLELGLIGSLFNFILCYFFYKKSKKILLILIPFLIAGVIFAPTSTPYLYTAFFIIIRLEKNKELE